MLKINLPQLGWIWNELGDILVGTSVELYQAEQKWKGKKAN